jgi:hypothetical protein
LSRLIGWLAESLRAFGFAIVASSPFWRCGSPQPYIFAGFIDMNPARFGDGSRIQYCLQYDI